jgi:hypothetical protein
MTPFAAWQAGLTLQQAFLHWGEGQRWAERHNSLLAELDRLRTDPRSPLHDKPATLIRLQSLGEAWDESFARLFELRTAFRVRIGRGHFRAVGFLRRTLGPDRLEAVPADCFNDADAVDWEASTIVSRKSAFVDVRVLLRAPPAPTGGQMRIGLRQETPR